jgi:hypothetical protein
MTPYRINRDDGHRDAIAGTSYASYDEAYAVLERYYSDLCCSDEREYYRIVEDPADWSTSPPPPARRSGE